MAGNESQREKRPKCPESAHDLLDNITPNIDGAALTPDQSDKSPGAGERSPALGVSIEAASETEHQAPALLYPVVAFGASAGGLQAFREILENLDPNTGMAFVLVTHLAPDQKSFLSEIVERYTHMPVLSVEDGQRPLPNHLYVLLPNQSATVKEGVFHVEQRTANERFPRTIDRCRVFKLNSRQNPSEMFGAKLTPRQREVLQLVAEGKTSKEISVLLNISSKTVEFHRNALMDELGVRTVAELTRYAISRGIVNP